MPTASRPQQWPVHRQVSDLPNVTFTPDLLHQVAQRSFGGAIGTGGKGAVAIRIDDGQDKMTYNHAGAGTNLLALLNGYNMPFSLVTLGCGPGGSYGQWNTATWADIRNWVCNYGGETWLHGYDHLDMVGYDDHYNNLVTSKALLEAQELKVKGFAPPGIANGLEPDQLRTLWPGYTQYPGQLVYANHPLSEGWGGGELRGLPHCVYHQMPHITITDTVAQGNAAINYIAMAAERKLGLELMVHPAFIGQTGRTTWTRITEIFAFLHTLWNVNNAIEVLTPSGLAFADQNISTRLDLLAGGDFEGLTVDTGYAGKWTDFSPYAAGTDYDRSYAASWANFNGADEATIETTGGHGGSNFLHFPSTENALINQRPTHLDDRGAVGETWLFEGWWRAPGAAAKGRVLLQEYNVGASSWRLNIDKQTPLSSGTGWTRFRIPFTIPTLDTDGDPVTTLQVSLGRGFGGDVDWDDVHIYKV